MLMGKISKVSFVLAALLAIFLLAGRLNPYFMEGVLSPSGALTTCSTLVSQQQGLDRVVEWTALSLIGIMVGMAWAIIGQILGGTFGGPKYNEFIKGMIWGSIETAALLGIFMALFAVLWPFGMENIDKARAYAVLAKNTVMFDFGLMLSANFIVGFITNMNPQFKIPSEVYITVGFQVAPMFKPIIDVLGVTMQLITTAVVLWGSQEFLLCFIKAQMLIVLLPAGFFLRGFGLKAAGNALIGIAISLFFIYPYMVNMLGQVVSSQLQDDLDTSHINQQNLPAHLWQYTCIDKPICCLHDAPAGPGEPYLQNGPNANVSVAAINNGNFRMDLEGTSHGPNMCMYNTILGNVYRAFFIDNIMKGDFGAFAGGAAAVGTAVLLRYMNISWLSVGLMVPLGAFSLYAITEMVYFVFIVTMLVPMFIVFVTLTMAKEIAKVLGTEIDLSSLEKLI